jgi:hypothetical protein
MHLAMPLLNKKVEEFPPDLRAGKHAISINVKLILAPDIGALDLRDQPETRLATWRMLPVSVAGTVQEER